MLLRVARQHRRADEGVVRVALFAVTAAMFVVAVTIPEAFDDLPGGLSGPVVLAACSLVVRVLHLVIYWHAARGDVGLRRQLLRAALPMLGGAVLLFSVALLPQQLSDDPARISGIRTALWVLALAVDYGGIILLALGFKKVLSYVGDGAEHDLTDPLHGLGLYALYGGVALYLLAHLGFRLRCMGSVNWPRAAAVLLLVGLVPLADRLPALAALAMLAAVCVGMVVAETLLFGEARRALREGALTSHGAGAEPGH